MLYIRWFEADRVDAEFVRDVDHLVQRVERFVRDRGVDADAQRRVLARGRRLQAPQARRRALERALHAAGLVVHLVGAVDRDADVLEETLTRQLGERLGALVGDDRAVGREVAAGVLLLAEDLHDAKDVLAHENLAAGEADLQAGFFRKRAPQDLERQFLPPLAFDVQQRADVAELAVQIAPHRRLVDDPGGEAAGMAVLLAQEVFDAVCDYVAAIARQ